MPNQLSILSDPEINGLIVTIQGRVEPSSMANLYDAVLSHPDFFDGANLIWDLRLAPISHLSISDHSEFLYHVSKFLERRKGARIAWVFSRGDEYQRACTFLANALTKIPFPMEIFNDLLEARAWIRK